MISEQTATQTLTHALRLLANVGNVVDLTGIRSTGCRKRLRIVAEQATPVIAALMGALAACGNPTFFELERPGPTQQRLGPGLSRESDSFWPLSEW